jgi:hypothetical protein
VNDAMMALLIGARLGEHALSTSAASPDALLPDLFGQIPGIERLNRTAGDAARLLRDAETHLAYMAIPYALTIHGAFLVSVCEMVRAAGRDEIGGDYDHPRVHDPTKLSLENGHETGLRSPPATIESRTHNAMDREIDASAGCTGSRGECIRRST